MKKRTNKEIVILLLFLIIGGVLLYFKGNTNWLRLFIMTICGAGGMLLLIFLEWFFLVRNKGKSIEENKVIEDNKKIEKNMPYSQNDICVICGAYCPEGRHVCERCEKEN